MFELAFFVEPVHHQVVRQICSGNLYEQVGHHHLRVGSVK